MQINFSKYQGTGNDFVIIDNRDLTLNRQQTELYAFLCHRRFGIGADGVILLQNHPDYAFEMVYFNSDGRESTMCGNGGRCIAAFAAHLGIIQPKEMVYFLAIDGEHQAIYEDGKTQLLMTNVKGIQRENGDFQLDTGSPHYVQLVETMESVDVFQAGRSIRYSEPFKQEGINVNFVVKIENGIQVATYERGVEDETYSCGTGVVASAIVAVKQEWFPAQTDIPIVTKGGILSVRCQQTDTDSFGDIWLSGAATFVFRGTINYLGDKKD